MRRLKVQVERCVVDLYVSSAPRGLKVSIRSMLGATPTCFLRRVAGLKAWCALSALPLSRFLRTAGIEEGKAGRSGIGLSFLRDAGIEGFRHRTQLSKPRFLRVAGIEDREGSSPRLWQSFLRVAGIEGGSRRFPRRPARFLRVAGVENRERPGQWLWGCFLRAAGIKAVLGGNPGPSATERSVKSARADTRCTAPRPSLAQRARARPAGRFRDHSFGIAARISSIWFFFKVRSFAMRSN